MGKAQLNLNTMLQIIVLKEPFRLIHIPKIQKHLLLREGIFFGILLVENAASPLSIIIVIVRVANAAGAY